MEAFAKETPQKKSIFKIKAMKGAKMADAFHYKARNRFMLIICIYLGAKLRNIAFGGTNTIYCI
jgi:hypothetical protein